MPPDPKVAVGAVAVVERGGDFLMLQRGGEGGGLASDGYGSWSFPGGWIEHGETAEDTARRECDEEVGVLVRPVEQAGFTVTMAPAGFTVATLFVRCEYAAGVPRNREPEKALAVAWLPGEVFAELDLMPALDQWWRRPR